LSEPFGCRIRNRRAKRSECVRFGTPPGVNFSPVWYSSGLKRDWTEVLWRFEHAGFPMSWAFGTIAVPTLLVVEICHRWEAYEY
jgi:hypothetical protein